MGAVGRLAPVVRVGVAVAVAEDEEGADHQAHADADQEVGGEDRDDRADEGEQVLRAHRPRVAKVARVGQPEPRVDEDRGERGERDQVEQRRHGEHRDGEEGAVGERGAPRPSAGPDVRRAAHDHARHRQPADEPREHVAGALREQLAVGGRVSLVRVELVGGLEAEQRLEARHEADRQRDPVDPWVGERRPVGEGEQSRHVGQRAHGRQRHHRFARQGEGGPEGAEREVDDDAEQHDDERRRRERAEPLRRASPEGEHEQRRRRERDRRRHRASRRVEDRRERIAARLREAVRLEHFDADAERVGELLEDEDQPDAGQHSADHARREEVADDPRLAHAERELHDAGEHDGDEEGVECAELHDRREHDRRQPRRRPADHELRAAEARHDEPAHDAGDDPGEQRRARGEGDAEAERKGDEEDDEAGAEVGAPGGGEALVHRLCLRRRGGRARDDARLGVGAALGSLPRRVGCCRCRCHGSPVLRLSGMFLSGHSATA